MPWTSDEVRSFGAADDFRVAPYRADEKTPGTPTVIWPVTCDGRLFIRPVVSDKCELVSAWTVTLPLMPRRDRATR